jgi:hypothetical protein
VIVTDLAFDLALLGMEVLNELVADLEVRHQPAADEGFVAAELDFLEARSGAHIARVPPPEAPRALALGRFDLPAKGR